MTGLGTSVSCRSFTLNLLCNLYYHFLIDACVVSAQYASKTSPFPLTTVYSSCADLLWDVHLTHHCMIYSNILHSISEGIWLQFILKCVHLTTLIICDSIRYHIANILHIMFYADWDNLPFNVRSLTSEMVCFVVLKLALLVLDDMFIFICLFCRDVFVVLFCLVL